MATKTEYLDAMFKSLKRSHHKLRKESHELFDVNQDNYRATGEFIRRINDMAKVERSEALRNILSNIAQDATRQRAEQVELGSQLKQNVSEDMDRFQELLEQHMENSKRRLKEYQQIEKEQQKIRDLRVAGGVAAREAENASVHHRETLGKVEQQLNDNLANFEYIRCQYVIDKLERILRTQIQYHVHSIESLSQSLNQLHNINPAREAHSLWRELENFDSKSGINTANHRPPNFSTNPVAGSGLRISMPEAMTYIVPQRNQEQMGQPPQQQHLHQPQQQYPMHQGHPQHPQPYHAGAGYPPATPYRPQNQSMRPTHGNQSFQQKPVAHGAPLNHSYMSSPNNVGSQGYVQAIPMSPYSQGTQMS